MKKKIGAVFIVLMMSNVVLYPMKSTTSEKSTNIIDARRANINGLHKVQLLKRLFNAAKPHPHEEFLTISTKLSDDEAIEIIKSKKYIGEVNGKKLNIDLSGNIVDTSGYNKANGDGKHLAEKIINQMRIEKKKVNKEKKKVKEIVN